MGCVCLSALVYIILGFPSVEIMNVCVAVISNKNSPLFFKASNPDKLLSLQFRVYGSLDIIEDKIGSFPSKQSYGDKDATNRFLGLLYTIDDHCVYGYVTNTNVKVSVVICLAFMDWICKCFFCFQFILVQEDHSAVDVLKSGTVSQAENQVRKTFESLHDAYLDLVSSPFYIPNTPIDPLASGSTKKFEKVVDDILKRPPTMLTHKFWSFFLFLLLYDTIMNN